MSKYTKQGTFLIEFTDGSSIICGNNYKPWYTHAVEYMRLRVPRGAKKPVLKSVWYSRTPFVDDGGLKWCHADSYQELISEVGQKTHKILKPFKKYQWDISESDYMTLLKELGK